MRPRIFRADEIRRLRHRLERDGYPRLQMLLIVALTGGAGFMASSILFHHGFTTMWSRYLLAFVVAYLAFLCLLWLWLRTRPEDYEHLPDPPQGCRSDPLCEPGPSLGDGGADDGLIGDSMGDAVSAAVGADELAIPLMAILMVAALAFSSLWVVYAAPTLFAELLLDGVLAAGLYRRLRGLETRHWLETAVRCTAWPFALTALTIAAIGWGMAWVAPDAHTLGEVLAVVRDAG